MEEVSDYNATLKKFLYAAILLSVIAFIILLVLVYDKCIQDAVLLATEKIEYCNHSVKKKENF